MRFHAGLIAAALVVAGAAACSSGSSPATAGNGTLADGLVATCTTDGATYTIKFTATTQTVSIASVVIANYDNGAETGNFTGNGLAITLTPGQSRTITSFTNSDGAPSCAVASWSPPSQLVTVLRLDQPIPDLDA